MSDRRFVPTATPIDGLMVVQRSRIEDERGFLSRIYCEELEDIGFVDPVVQINHTVTRLRGTVRGLHFQLPPHTDDKLVTCLRGEIFDVAVDLRAMSPTHLQWHGERLSGDNGRSLFIPKGFAHGFQTLTDDCELLYLHTAIYAPDAEGGLHALDPTLDIRWPLPVTAMSDRDSVQSFVDESFRIQL